MATEPDWHTVMDAVVIYGEPVIDDPDRFAAVVAVGLDETLFGRFGPFPGQPRSSTCRPVSCSTSWRPRLDGAVRLFRCPTTTVA